MRLTHAKRGLNNAGQNSEMGLAKALFPGQDGFEADGDRGRQPAPLGASLMATGELTKVGFDIHNDRVRAVAYRCQDGDLRGLPPMRQWPPWIELDVMAPDCTISAR